MLTAFLILSFSAIDTATTVFALVYVPGAVELNPLHTLLGTGAFVLFKSLWSLLLSAGCALWWRDVPLWMRACLRLGMIFVGSACLNNSLRLLWWSWGIP